MSETDPSVLEFSADVTARTIEAAVDVGLTYFDADPLSSCVEGRLTRLVAMDDEGRLDWEADPAQAR